MLLIVCVLLPADENLLDRVGVLFLSMIGEDNHYKNVQLIIVNDSSTDKTKAIALKFQRQNKNLFTEIRVINVSVRGKAKALNKGMKYSKGSLIMCLDADSALTPTALENAVKQFRKKNLVSLSANVKIFPSKGILNHLQRIEYLICYQMKKAETFSNIQYIVGGIGSMYRKRAIKTLGNYDTDTITEDIDLSMKLIEHYGKDKKIGYDPSVVVYTESVYNISGLHRQRFRWKYGRYQVFLKRKSLFLSTNTKNNKLLSWIYLPYALYAEIAYALEPLIFILLIALIINYGDASMLISSFIVFIFYTVMHITGATEGYSNREKLLLTISSPFAFFGMYIISYVEYIATLKGIFYSKRLIHEHKFGGSGCDWKPVERKGTAIIS